MSSTLPLVSVLINNYNYSSYIQESIESVLNQTYQNFEIIVVDDGSTDNSKEIILHLTHENPRIQAILKENGGQASAFNAGFQASRGELIAFLDSDDWWKPHKLEEVVRWHNFLSGKYALLQHNVDVWDNGKTYPFKSAMYSGNCFKHTIRSGELGLFVGTSGLVFKREILEKVMPVPHDFRISADAYLTRTSFTFDFVYSIPESLGYYRKHNNAVLGNTTHNHAKFHEQTLFPYLNNFYETQNIDFQFRPRHESFGVSDPMSNMYLMKLLIRKKFDEITTMYPKIAIYGEGDHSRWLSKMLGNYKNDSIVAVLETNPIATQIFFGKIAIEAQTWSPMDADAIILSTNANQVALKEKCQTLYGHNIKLIDLYEEGLQW